MRRSVAVAVGSALLAGILAASGSARPLGQASVQQLEFPGMLAAPGEPLEVGYDTRKIPDATGYLYVRNDTQIAVTRIRLQRRRASQLLEPDDRLRVLRATIPGSVVRGDKLFYYAVLSLDTGSQRIPALSTESVWILTGARVVHLRTHRFGHVRAPGVIVARAGPEDVGFENPPEGAAEGPWSFDIAPDRTVWLLDELDKRLLVWPRGHPSARPREILLGPSFPLDFARGPAGSVYFTRRVPGSFALQLLRVTSNRGVLWQHGLATALANQQLRLGPDGTLYWTGPASDARRTERSGPTNAWCPAASPAGRPFSVARQRRTLAVDQPLPGGRSLVWTMADFEGGGVYGPAPHEERVALIGRTGGIVHAWRIESRTAIWFDARATPALVGDDPVIVLTASTSSSPSRSEYLVLRLARTVSGTRGRFSLPHAGYDTGGHAAWGDVITDLRIGPGPFIYQLGSSPGTGVTIYRYPL